ncbi:MAG: hypothetical protein HGA87_07380 [Desulfobulbaceae bacterium]|jgi:hypothetical protein|nr:hypothetical protein [Desulfobulbaceae bacterium]
MVSTQDFIIELFCRIDDRIKDKTKRSDAKLYVSEVIYIGMLYALKTRAESILPMVEAGL